MLGGGQDAMSVTTTSSRQGKFEVRFYHLAFEDEIGRVKGHFGPINTLAFHPSGKGYASGGEGVFFADFVLICLPTNLFFSISIRWVCPGSQI